MTPGKLLGSRTEQRLLRKLDEVQQNQARWPDAGLQQPVLVKCTSAAAASGSGVGAQCFPATILNLTNDATTLPTSPLLGEVWLTVLGPAGSITPVSGQVYAGLVSGEVTAGGSTRPRVFASNAGGGCETNDVCDGEFVALEPVTDVVCSGGYIDVTKFEGYRFWVQEIVP